MKALVGLLMIVAGIALGLYVGVVVCFIGGIVDIIDQIKAVETSSMVVAWGIVKIIFASFCGWVSAFVLVVPGLAVLKSS